MRQNRLALGSAAILALGWLWLGLFLASHMNTRYAAQWWVQTAAFICYLFSPLALLFGMGGALFEQPKRAGLLAIVLSVASGVLVFWIRP